VDAYSGSAVLVATIASTGLTTTVTIDVSRR
jgi:hypothetical protein